MRPWRCKRRCATIPRTVRRTHGIPLQIRVGLNSGEVVVRTIGNDLHMDYSAVGQTTHLAARMEQLAHPGSIMLTAATLRLVEGLIQVKALGPIPVKGMAEPVEVFELTGASAIRRRLQAAVARGLTKFVGRDTEIEASIRLWNKPELAMVKSWQPWARPGWGSLASCMSFIHSHRTQGWLRAGERLGVVWQSHTLLSGVLICSSAMCHVEDGDEPVPSGPK